MADADERAVPEATALPRSCEHPQTFRVERFGFDDSHRWETYCSVCHERIEPEEKTGWIS